MFVSFFFNKNSNTSHTYCHILLPMVGGLRVVILDYEIKKPSYYNPGFNDCVILLDTNLQIDYSHISLDFLIGCPPLGWDGWKRHMAHLHLNELFAHMQYVVK